MYSLDVLRFLLFFLRKISNDVILLDSIFQVAGKPAYIVNVPWIFLIEEDIQKILLVKFVDKVYYLNYIFWVIDDWPI